MSGAPYMELARALGAEAVLVVGALAALTLDFTALGGSEPGRRTRLLGWLTILVALAATLPVCDLFNQPAWTAPGGVVTINSLSLLYKLVILGLLALTALLSLQFDVGRHVGEYFALLMLAAVGMLVMVATEELLTLFVALELTSLSLYVLTAFQKRVLRSQEAAIKYFLFGAISSAFLLFGFSYLYGMTGTTHLRALGESLGSGPAQPLAAAALLFVLVGLGFKIAVVPFHLWAPDAYEGAPTPVTAWIATGSKVASFFVLTKLLIVGFAGMHGAAAWGGFQPGWTMLLAVTAAASMILGNVVAIVQRNVKRLLAYSSIAHAGYILIGLIAATPAGVTAVLYYLVVYALSNLGAFGVVATLSAHAGGDDVSDFNGMARRAPLLSLLMVVFVLSLAGIPPLGGFLGKFYLFAAAVQQDARQFGLLWLVIVGILMSAVSLYYYLVLLKHFVVHEPAADEPMRAPWPVAAGLAVVAVLVILLGVLPQPFLALLNRLVGGL